MLWKAIVSGLTMAASGVGVLRATIVLDQWLLLVPGFVLVLWGASHAFTRGTAPPRT
jgi:hypothetical protein